MNEKQPHSEDQINFSGLKDLVYAFLQEFFRFVEFTRIVVRRKIVYIIIGAVLGVLVSLLYYYKWTQVYKASMVVIFNKLTARSYGKVVDNLNTLVATGDQEQLSRELNIPLEYAAPLIVLEARNMNDQPLSLDTSSKNFQLFKINVTLVSPIAIDTLENALLNYFASRPYMKAMGEMEKKYHLERLRAIDSDLAKLDSLKTTFNQFLASSKIPTSVYSNGANPADLFEQSTELSEQRETIHRLLYVEQNPVSLIDGFKLVKAPRSKALPDLMFIFGAVGLFTGFLFGLLLETREQVLPR